MSDFGWRHVVAVGLALTLSTALWFSLKPREPNLFVYQYGQGPKPGYRAGGSGCEPNVVAFMRDEREALRERERCEKEAEEHRIDRDDLVQQTRAANASEAQAGYAFEQTRIGVLQTIGGFLTLIAAAAAAFYARSAARYANIAARETKRSADIANDALRPWVSATPLLISRFRPVATINDDGFFISIIIDAKKSWALPGRNSKI